MFTLQAATPTFSQSAAPIVVNGVDTFTYSASLTGSFTTATTGATFHYTTDGTTPSCATSPVYTAPFALRSKTYQAVACKVGYVDSAPSAATAVTVALTPPTITPAAGTVNTALSAQATNAPANPAGFWVCWSTSANGVTISRAGLQPDNKWGLQRGCCVYNGAQGSGRQPNSGDCVCSGWADQFGDCHGWTIQPAAATPFVDPNAKNDVGAALPSFTVPVSGIANLVIAQAKGSDPAGVTGPLSPYYLCYTKNPGAGLPPACGTTTNHCLNGSTEEVTGYDVKAGGVSFVAGDSISGNRVPRLRFNRPRVRIRSVCGCYNDIRWHRSGTLARYYARLGGEQSHAGARRSDQHECQSGYNLLHDG